MSRLASHWIPSTPGRAECRLCPHHCRPKNDRMGFCGVRGTVDDTIHTFNYGRSLPATEEVIETEAVFHYAPGARILSLGNVGCSLACSFCQNWQTSQVRHLDNNATRSYTPEQVVELCLENRIPVLSWTYNDPVVWHEFVVETSRLAQKAGIRTLYKSAFFIDEAAVEELIDCIDIFSISLKSMSDEFYRKATRSRLQPVLDRIEQVAASGRHLELSQLIIPKLNDSHADIRKTIDWVLGHLGRDVPLHFVAFHPAYQYTHVPRTALSTLLNARSLALSAGIRHVYLGNTQESRMNDTCCDTCGKILVRRFGLHAEIEALNAQGRCTQCGTPSPIGRVSSSTAVSNGAPVIAPHDLKKHLTITWREELHSVHIYRTAGHGIDDELQIRSLDGTLARQQRLAAGLDRFLITRSHKHEQGVVISWDTDCEYHPLELLDRAHYPTGLENEFPLNFSQAVDDGTSS